MMGALIAAGQMTPEELIRAAEEVFGSRWVRPLARTLGKSPRLVRSWKKGERRITEETAEQIRALYRIGPVGTVIRSAVSRTLPRINPWSAHRVAMQALSDLVTAGLIEAADQTVVCSGGPPINRASARPALR